MVVAETAILFIPGWLRMLDLACHSWCRPLAGLTGALVRPFVWLDRHVPFVRRHGYLLATGRDEAGPDALRRHRGRPSENTGVKRRAVVRSGNDPPAGSSNSES